MLHGDTNTTNSLWNKNRHVSQCGRIEDPEAPHANSHLTLDKRSKDVHWRKDSLVKSCWGKWKSTRIMKLDPYLSPCTQLN